MVWQGLKYVNRSVCIAAAANHGLKKIRQLIPIFVFGLISRPSSLVEQVDSR
jgi:hypothetical protein